MDLLVTRVIVASLGLLAGLRAQERLPYRVAATVVDLAGQPIEGAGLVYGASDTITTTQALTAPHAKTGAKGRFRVTIPARAPLAPPVTALIAAPGKTVAEVSITGAVRGFGAERHYEVDLGTVILRPGVKIRGLVRSQGKPVAGARVKAVDVFRSRHLALPFTENYVSFATTDAKGRFVLEGVPPRGASVLVSSSAHMEYRVQWTNRFTPLVADLTSSGRSSGVVVDAGGAPQANCAVQVHYEACETAQAVRAGAEGRFDFVVRAPGRYRLTATRIGLESVVVAPQQMDWSDRFTGPQEGIKLEIRSGGGAARIEVRCTGPDGKRIKEFRAGVAFMNPQIWKRNKTFLQYMFSRTARPASADGVARLTGPLTGQPTTGRILVKAKGFAPGVIKEVDWDAGKPPKLEVQLDKESVIAGVVKDARGKPVPNATVTVGLQRPMPMLSNPLMQISSRLARGQSGVARTDVQGRYRIGSLGAQRYYVTAEIRGRPMSKVRRVTLGEQEVLGDHNIELPRGATITGKIVGAKIGTGWLVKETPPSISQGAVIQLPTSVRFARGEPKTTGAVRVGADGKFEICGLSKGRHEFSLLIPYAEGVLQVPMKSVRVGDEDLEQEFDIETEVPGRIRGVVKINGAALLPGRLLVLATRADRSTRNNPMFSITPGHSGVRALVGRGGKFAMYVREGKHRLRILDLATGVTLYQGSKTIKVEAGAEVTASIEAQLAMVMLELVAESEKTPKLWNRIQVSVQHPVPKGVRNNRTVILGLGSNIVYDSGVGLELRPGQLHATLILPLRETRLHVRTSAHNLDPLKSIYNSPPIGEESFTPQPDKPNRIKLTITSPDV